jgi:uncharacterized protein YyaL (SSP411 family)
MHTNKLIDEKSPYLLQHAHNPVNWYAWGEEAFSKARSEDKPIFLSVGYSTCHWCHVMERESFESDAIAELLNKHFVAIKVDREERPDVDRIYMSFVQASTGSGGWPMSVFLTPDLKPFFGGTYFPPDNRYGRPGFSYLLEQLAQAWRNERERIVESSDAVTDQLKTLAHVEAESGAIVDQAVFDSGYFQYRRMFDGKWGGFGNAPKFPRAVSHNFLFRYSYLAKNEEPADMVLFTLRAMARGGMNDQLGGGFHRYSVDERWFVPHFEKMLYDQAQLAISYLEGYQLSGDATLAQVARDILEYVLRDMTHNEGGFYSAEDADSVIDPAHPHEKGEGAFYIWTKSEIDTLLGQTASEWFCYRYGVEPNGNVHEDPHGEFTGKNILYEAHTPEETTARFGVSPADMRHANEKLLSARGRRVRPQLDDKVLTAWNGLMISAFAKGAQVLAEEKYLKAGQGAADFVLTKMRRGETLLRRFRDGDAAIDGFLDDYAFFVQGLLDLYEACFDLRYLQAAVELTDRTVALFADTEGGGFFSSTAGDPSLVMRMKDDYDGAEPSGNSVAALNLLRLAHIVGDSKAGESAAGTLRAFGSRIRQTPTGVPQMLVAAMHSVTPPRQVVIAGDHQGADPFLRALYERFLPFHNIILIDSDVARSYFSRNNEAIGGMTPIDGKTAAYVCENYACQLPVTSVDKFVELLQ